MSAYGVTPEGIREAAFGVTIPAGAEVDQQLLRLIEKAELKLPGACLARRIAAGELTALDVASVVEDMVVRVTKNASGFRQATIDDYSVTLDTALSSGELYLSDEDRARLCPPTSGRRGRVGQVRINVPAWRMP